MADDAILTGVTFHRDAWGDPRYHYLAELLGLANNFEALGRMGALWSICTAMRTDIPPRAKIVVALGNKNAPEAIVEADLGELMPDGNVRVKGGFRLEWYDELKKPGRAEAGGVARAATAERGPGGRFAPKQPEDEASQRFALIEPHPASPASDQRQPALDQQAPASVQRHQPKDKDQNQDKNQKGGGERGRARARSAEPAPPLPTDWAPEPSVENAQAAAEAQGRGVVIAYALSKFRTKHAGKPIYEPDRLWRTTLASEFATPQQLRDGYTRVEREKHAQAARDRERVVATEQARLAETDREEARRIAKSALENDFKPPTKATA